MAMEELNRGPWCMACGYCLHGLAESSHACPECGGSLNAVSVAIPRAALNGRMALARLAALIPGAVVALAAFLFIAPLRQYGGAYQYVGDWRRPNSTAIHFAIVSTHSRRILLGRILAWPVDTYSGPVRVGSRSLSTLGIDPEGDYELEIEPGSLECRLTDRMTGKLVRPLGKFNLDVARELVKLNVDQSALLELALPIVNAVQSIASGVPNAAAPRTKTDYGRPEAFWATWTVTSLFGVVAWWANARLMRRRVVESVRTSAG